MEPKGFPKEWLAWFLPAKRAFCLLSLFFRQSQYTPPHRLSIPKPPSLMLPALASFHGLPAELILDICDFLTLDALLALKLTAPRLNAIIRLDPRRWQAPLSSCARRAIRTSLKSPLSKPDQQYCFLCNATYPTYMFSSSTSPACVSADVTTMPRDIIPLPPSVCSCHVGRLARIIRTDPGGRNEWVSNMDKMCMHCGNITAWSTCTCKCDSCSFWTVQTYTRYLNNNNECHRFLFWRAASASTDNEAGRLWVRESCSDVGKSFAFLQGRYASQGTPCGR
jgi:hypothetical protein